eukprot:scaffold137886_cov37-Tisochrysis_lutea.AAC.1
MVNVEHGNNAPQSTILGPRSPPGARRTKAQKAKSHEGRRMKDFCVERTRSKRNPPPPALRADS